MTHPLEAYLAAADDTLEAFAGRIGAPAADLRRAIAGEEMLSPSIARAVAAATDDAVPFEAFYGEAGNVADFSARAGDDGEKIDVVRLELLIAGALGNLGLAPETCCDAAVPAAEAVANAHAALARVTTRRGPARLLQVLEPILEEILAETPAPGPARLNVHEAAEAATSLYFQTLETGFPPA